MHILVCVDIYSTGNDQAHASGTRAAQVRLVLIDSVAFPFRMHRVEWRQQIVLLHELAAAARRIAARGIAVVATNQVTGYSANAFDDLQPALGARCPCATLLLLMPQLPRSIDSLRICNRVTCTAEGALRAVCLSR